MFKISDQRFKTLRRGDDDFMFSHDGYTMVPRAAFEINNQCPREYRLIITECINNGWLKPVAHMRDTEYSWEKLQS